MLSTLRTTALAAVALTTAAITVTPHRVQAQTYQIDCAILLCLSGGWPASVPCARARAEFIRRITPWPVEPPLQIWRCPMGVAYAVDPETLTSDRIYDILLELDQYQPQQSFPLNPDRIYEAATTLEGTLSDTLPAPLPRPAGTMEPQPAVFRLTGGDAAPLPEGFALQLVQDRADIDISGAEFNFVRSIRVYNVTYARQHESGAEGDCNRSFSMRVGTYGTQGDFSWRGSRDHRELPEAHTGLERYPSNCPSLWHRSVFVEWRDYEGNYGYEQVNY